MPVLLALATLLPSEALAGGPVFSVERGVQAAPFELELSPSEAGAVVTWSTDLGDPSEPYASPLAIDRTTIVRATETYTDGTSSAVATHTYVFVDDVLADSVMDTTVTGDATYAEAIRATLQDLPLLSVVSPGSLTTTEQEVSFEWLDPADDDFQIQCGGRRVGGHSLYYEKNSIRLSFRSAYGSPRLQASLFDDFATGVPPDDSFDALTLRGGSHDSVFYLGSAGQYLRNRWMDESQLEMGHLAPHGRYAHLFLDGAYTGLYHVRERFDASFMAGYLGGDEDDYEAVNGGRAVDGSGAAWSKAVAASTRFVDFEQWVDVQNLVDFMLLELYAANDWDFLPTQNWMAAGPTESGGSGFRFHASDSDISLYYGWTTNILDNGGPSYTFAYLIQEADPDFLVLLEDRIQVLFFDDGPLTADSAADRYSLLAADIEDAVVAESARWGGGWWDRDDEWVTERDALVEDWFPYRTDELIGQVQGAGWFPLDAPTFDTDPGVVAAGTVLGVSTTSGAEIWLTVDGEDPRLSGGEPSASAVGPSDGATVVLDTSTVVSARLRSASVWGPLRRGFFEIDESPIVVLNEWNAVDEGNRLGDDRADAVLGSLEGNGGDWLEFVVVADHADLRGWHVTMEDRAGDCGTLTFTDADVLADLPAGALFTVAEDLPEDTALDPDSGDWRFHLRAGEQGGGAVVSATAFDVSHREWTATLWDAEGHVAFGPVGEGIAPLDGISSTEVGLLATDPSASVRRDSSDYRGGTISTFALPNRWEGGQQDLSRLRDPGAGVDEAWDTGPYADGDDGGADGGADDGDDGASGGGASDPASGCGCAGTGGTPVLVLAVLGAALLSRRRKVWVAVALTACSAAGTPGGDSASSRDGGSNDGGGSADGGAGPQCWLDLDGDGFGDPERPRACSEHAVSDASDCDDDNDDVNPDAPEVCDGIDNDCDGLVDDEDEVADGVPFYADADGDGWGSDGDLLSACGLGTGMALSGGDCDDADPSVHPEAAEACDGIDQDCDGSIEDGNAGGSAACPIESCAAALAADPSAEDGTRWIELPSGTVAEIWCDMTTDGGGWTLGFVASSAEARTFDGFGSSNEAVESLATSPADASTSSSAQGGWIDLNAYSWETMRLAAWSSGSESYLSDDIDRAALRIDFGRDGYLLYGGESGYYWCGGAASYTDSGIGATDNPAGAPADCKGHGSLGSGWDFSASGSANQGLTLCGADGSYFLAATWGGTWTYYGAAGGAQVIWVR